MQKNLNIEKIIFKVVQMKFLAMHITNQKLSFDIFTIGNLLNIFMEHDLNILMIFGIKEKWIILTHTMYCCLLLQIYLCYLWLLLCSRDTYYTQKLFIHWTTSKTDKNWDQKWFRHFDLSMSCFSVYSLIANVIFLHTDWTKWSISWWLELNWFYLIVS